MSAERQHWMSILAQASPTMLAERMAALGDVPSVTMLRPPETGTVMVRGRAGAVGAPFNLGETTVTRCALRLQDGTVGHGYVSGRDARHAERAALCDALMQTAQAGAVRAAVIDPLEQDRASRRAVLAERAAGTKVDFFTMVRGDE